MRSLNACFGVDLLDGAECHRAVRRARLAARMRAQAENAINCPECDARGPHDESECGTLCCRRCGTHFDRRNV